MTTTVYETILWLQSKTSEKQFPIVEFSADTDMATLGWVSLTSTDRPEIVVTQATAEEFRAIADDLDGYLGVEHRVNTALKRCDLKCSWLVRVENVTSSAEGLSFQEFRKAYQPPKLFFRDILHCDSLAVEVSRTTRSEFERNGGKFIILQ
ncbi:MULTISPECIES: hypothetical protein [Paraburkholderia]|uniref:hypothetical protein n=1 Tax=Paraburkholderia TaxID=1822464 RepID=UPI001BA65AA2|nr:MULTISPECIES: hypothetical protein [Paraburkholderia]MCX4155384.1 hypothetical protein [Paraburkholderia aspalathi]MDN7164794.1 hypothetical protein [Paraburkholderia sp. SECH2]MDQ6393279.1 hypothetical protein [Paraburkholderia aspalathi]